MREALILLLKAEHELHHSSGIFRHRRAVRMLEAVGEAIHLLQEELEASRVSCIDQARKVEQPKLACGGAP
jgi:hypothetical protein